MATIELTNPAYFLNGAPSGGAIMGNETGNSSGRRVVRYSFQAPNTGASKVSVLLHITGVRDGSAIPGRFFIGTDPQSHVKAGSESPYTGDLTLAEDWLSFTGEAPVMLIPGRTYYFWVFPARDTFGYYGWSSQASEMETSRASVVLPVVRGDRWIGILPCVVRNGKWFLIAPCVVRGGKWNYIGGPV